MPAKTLIRRVAGIWKEIAATAVSAGAANAGDIPALDDTGRFDISMMPLGFGSDTRQFTASEALTASNLANLWNDSGTVKVRKADGTAEGKECNGFVLANAASAGQVLVYFGRVINGLSGLTPGARYYLSDTPGGMTLTPLTGAGKVDQYVGKAVSATELAFEPDDYLVKAA